MKSMSVILNNLLAIGLFIILALLLMTTSLSNFLFMAGNFENGNMGQQTNWIFLSILYIIVVVIFSLFIFTRKHEEHSLKYYITSSISMMIIFTSIFTLFNGMNVILASIVSMIGFGAISWILVNLKAKYPA